MPDRFKYLSAYPAVLQDKIQSLIEKQELASFLRAKYPRPHRYTSDKSLREYALNLKSRYMKKSSPLSQVQYDPKIHVINNALGLHSYSTRVHGKNLKTKNSIRISTVFKLAPEAFLNMIVVHELAHLKEREHNKDFYKLCMHMLPDYYQLEFDTRVYLTQLELGGDIYT
jgi:predicted metal-dependent hydrolase